MVFIRYDGQDAAMLGQAAYAWSFVRARVLAQGTCENSAFPGYLASDPGDGAPQVESNGEWPDQGLYSNAT